MTLGRYLLGMLALAAMVVPWLWAAHRWRARLVPELPGALAHLATVVLASSAGLLGAQVLGAVGLFRLGPLLALSAVAIVLGLLAGRPRPEVVPNAPPGQDRRAVVVAAAVVAMLFGQWCAYTWVTVDRGPVDVDTQSYHLPHAARFVQTATTTALHYIAPDEATAYHPANSETIHAAAMLAFGRDNLSPFLNLGWLALLLTAAWCIGRPWGAGPASVVGVSILLVSPLMASTQGGSAMTDVMSLFYLLVSVALLLHEPRTGASLTFAGLAAGAGVGTKLTLLLPVGLLTIAVIALSRHSGVRRAIGASLFWTAGVASAGSFWFLRNLARVGNPVPSLRLKVGPLSLPSPRMTLIDRIGYSVSDYLFDVDVWRRSFVPGLTEAFGPLWVLTLGIATIALFGVLARGQRSPTLRALGAVGLLAAVGYVFTPTSAAGPPGEPVLFTANLRYLAPGLLLGLALAPALPALRARPTLTVAALAAVCPFGAFARAGWPTAYGPSYLRFGLLVAGALFAGFIGIAALKLFVPRRVIVGLLVVAMVAASFGGFPVTGRYLARRYTSQHLAHEAAFRWARDLHGQRIGMTGFFLQYGLYGSDLSNRVQYIGAHGRDHSFTDYTSCAAWRRAVNHGGYDYVVVMPPFEGRPEPQAARWLRGAIGAEAVLEREGAAIFAISARLDPVGCPG